MTSAIIAVTPSHPESFEELIQGIQFDTAEDIALALDKAERFMDVGKTVTVRERFVHGDEEDPSRAIYQSVDDEGFRRLDRHEMEMVRLTSQYRRPMEAGRRCLLINYDQGYLTRRHWMTTSRTRIYPVECSKSQHFQHDASCEVCRGWTDAQPSLVSEFLFVDSGGILRRGQAGQRSQLHHDIGQVMNSMRTAGFSCAPIMFYRQGEHRVHGPALFRVCETDPTPENFDSIIYRVDFQHAAERLPFLLSAVANVVYPLVDGAAPRENSRNE